MGLRLALHSDQVLKVCCWPAAPSVEFLLNVFHTLIAIFLHFYFLLQERQGNREVPEACWSVESEERLCILPEYSYLGAPVSGVKVLLLDVLADEQPFVQERELLNLIYS